MIVSMERKYLIVNTQGAPVNVNKKFSPTFPKKVVIDGYFTWDSKVTLGKLIRKKNRRFLHPQKLVDRTPIFHAFDYIPLSDYEQKKSELTFSERIQILKSLDIWDSQVKVADGYIILAPIQLKKGTYLIRSMNSKWGLDKQFTLRV